MPSLIIIPGGEAMKALYRRSLVAMQFCCWDFRILAAMIVAAAEYWLLPGIADPTSQVDFVLSGATATFTSQTGTVIGTDAITGTFTFDTPGAAIAGTFNFDTGGRTPSRLHFGSSRDCEPALPLSWRLRRRVGGRRRLSRRLLDLWRIDMSARALCDLGIEVSQVVAGRLRRFAELGFLASIEAPLVSLRAGAG